MDLNDEVLIDINLDQSNITIQIESTENNPDAAIYAANIIYRENLKMLLEVKDARLVESNDLE